MFTESAELYDLFYDWKNYRAEAERVRDMVRARRPDASTLLDVACGTGSHMAHLRDWFSVEGLDADDGMLAVARRRLTGTPLHRADMVDFQLGRTFDAVICLFSSIGYVVTTERLKHAIETMAAHLAPGGVLVVEPWLTPAAFDPAVLGRMIVVERPDLQAVRMNASRVDGQQSILHFHYLVAQPGSIEHRTETHTLGLFAENEMRAAFEGAALEVEHDPDGLMGRGLWIATRR